MLDEQKLKLTFRYQTWVETLTDVCVSANTLIYKGHKCHISIKAPATTIEGSSQTPIAFKKKNSE